MAHPTRQVLIEAGFELAASVFLHEITVDAVVNKAGVAKGTFYVHFKDRTAYLIALYREFHARLREGILPIAALFPPGAERLRAGVKAYLDSCLKERAVKAFLLGGRAEAAIEVEMRERNTEFALLARQDFAALGWPHVEETARLFVILVAEVALTEQEIGSSEVVRGVLWRFLRIEE